VSEQVLFIYPIPSDTTILRGESVQIIIQGGNNQMNYIWDPTSELNCTSCGSTAVATPYDDILYTIIVSDSLGCTATAIVQIFVDTIPSPILYVPNAFTPNGDGVNDEFNVEVRNYLTFHILIFDRWGELVFESYDPMVGWDGTFRGKECNPGVFVYYVDVAYDRDIGKPDNMEEYRKGSITLIR
jgi:gliding motility-associated-like protein